MGDTDARRGDSSTAKNPAGTPAPAGTAGYANREGHAEKPWGQKTIFTEVRFVAPYKKLFLTALDTWKLNKIFGNGIKSFREDCHKIIKKQSGARDRQLFLYPIVALLFELKCQRLVTTPDYLTVPHNVNYIGHNIVK